MKNQNETSSLFNKNLSLTDTDAVVKSVLESLKAIDDDDCFDYYKK